MVSVAYPKENDFDLDKNTDKTEGQNFLSLLDSEETSSG